MKTSGSIRAGVGWVRLPERPGLVSLFLFLLVILCYLPATRCGFVTFDDDTYVYNNLHVQNGPNLSSLSWALTTRLNGSWHPLTWISTILDYSAYGSKPWGHHLTNVLIHGLTTVLVFLLFRQISRSSACGFFVAALFGLHPLHVESVAWVSERKDVLCAFFWILSLLMYVRYAATRASSDRLPVQTYYLLCLFFFVCGLMSKPMIVTLPFLLLLMDWWPLRRFRGPVDQSKADAPASETPVTRLLLEKLPFFILALTGCLVTMSGQRAAGAMMAEADDPLKIRLINAIISYGTYLRQFVWPSGLAVYYPYPKAVHFWNLLAAALALAAITLFVLSIARRKPAMVFGWLWFGITLLPVIGLIQVGGQAHADRYMYVPLIGLSVMAVWLVGDFLARWKNGLRFGHVGGGIVIVLCAILTIKQIAFWLDSESLYRRALAVTRDNAVAENNLGDILLAKAQFEESLRHCQEAARLAPAFPAPFFNMGDALAGLGRLDQAIKQYEEALGRFPADAGIYERYGRILSLKGRLQDSIVQFEKSLALDPNQSQSHCNLAITLIKLRRFDEATSHLREAVRLKPDYITARSNLGSLLGREGKTAESIEQFRAVLKLKPSDAVAHCNLADALASEGRLDDACREYQEALRLAPSDAVALRNLAVAQLKLGQLSEAVDHLNLAVRSSPGDALAHSELGIALGKQGKLDAAIEQFKQAVTIDPNNVDALCNLGVALGAKGQLDAAIANLQAALRLKPDYTNAINNLRLAESLKSHHGNTSQ